MIILDTCTLLWLVRGEGLPVQVARRIDEILSGASTRVAFRPTTAQDDVVDLAGGPETG